MYLEEDFLQLSALQHFIFCPRQCALIHIEQLWDENLFTAEGRIMHERAHKEDMKCRKGARIERGVSLRSNLLGLVGKADVVEFLKADDETRWTPYPVEYKRGKPKANDCDKVQLCAQATCLEEMLGVKISSGALYYGRIRHRLEVCFDDALRRETEDTANRLHEFIRAGKTPKPEYNKRCKSCSLFSICMPKAMEKKISVEKYLQEAVEKQ